jgi:flagellar basal-body rod protein FlgC
MPNVNALAEMMDLREASRAYEANLNMIDAARQMTSRALDLLRR